MKHYELTYLISPDLSEEEASSLSSEIASFVTQALAKGGDERSSSASEKQGILEKNLSLFKKHLSYAIKKKTTAYLTTLNFQIPERGEAERRVEMNEVQRSEPEMLERLKKQIKSESRILRHLILTKKMPKKVTEIPIKKPRKIAKPKAELKEIEKKLEEILGKI